MKKIIILHARHSYNYGTFMMVINFIEYFSKFSNDKKIKYLLDFIMPEDIERLGQEIMGRYDFERLETPEIKIKKYRINFLSVLKTRYLSPIKDIKKHRPDAVIILGGDNLSEYYTGWKIIEELFKIYRISKFAPVFLISQTIGPFNFWRKKIASFCLKNCQIYSRDSLSYNYLKNEMKLKKIFNSQDLALLDLPRQRDGELFGSILKRYDLEENNYITLVPSGAYKQYTSSYDDYIKSWSEIVAHLVKNKALENIKIVLLSHVSRPDKKSDGRIIRSVLENLDSVTAKKVIKIDEEILSSEARAVLGNSLFVISGRMHSNLSALQMSKPAIALSYSVKYKGVIGEGLKMEDLIIDAKDENLWKGKIVDLIINKINYLINNYDNISRILKNEVQKSQKILIEQMSDLANKIV